METYSIVVNSVHLDFDYAWKISQALAKSYNPDSILTAWFDRKKGRCSPSQSECAAAGFSGWEEYSRHQSGRKKMVVGDGDYVFIFT